MAHDQQTYQRGMSAALIGLFIQLILTIGGVLVAMWTQAPAATVVAWHLAGGLPIWIILCLVFNQHRLERIEALEAAQLAASDAQSAALFQDQGADLRVAQRRLDRLYKWGVNIVSLGLAIYLLLVGGILTYQNYRLVTVKQVVKEIKQGTGPDAPPPVQEMVWEGRTAREVAEVAIGKDVNSRVLVATVIGLALLAFLVARYIAGMTKVREWQLLRGAAAYLMGNAVVAVLLIVGAVFVLFENNLVLAYLSVVLPVFLLIIGAEILIVFLLNAYRPRRPDELPRPAFDSRLLGWLTAPESIGKIVSETINYQFGFEISRSWFYRLMGRSLTPLCAFAMLTLILISSVVVVAPHEQAIVTRFGRIVPFDESARVTAMPPGLHFKMPWPIDRVDKYAVGRVHQVSVGSGAAKADYETAILWTTQHVMGEEKLLVTAPTTTERVAAGAGISLVAAEVIVQFRVDDLVKFVTRVPDPGDLDLASRQRDMWNERAKRESQEKSKPVLPGPQKGERVIDPCALLTWIADRRVNSYFATHDIDMLLARQRLAAGEALRDEIQKDVDAADIGLKVVFVGVTGIHPPQQAEVAAAFHEQIGAIQEKQATIEKATKEANETLTKVAGSRAGALDLAEAINKLEQRQSRVEQLRRAETPDEAALAAALDDLHKQDEVVVRLLTESRGEASSTILSAVAYRWQRPIGERGDAEMFKAEVSAFRNAPRYYAYKRYMSMLADALKGPRKYIVPPGTRVPERSFRLDLKENEAYVPFGDSDK